MVEMQYNKVMQALSANDRKEFISAKLKKFYNKKGSKIKCVALYMHKKWYCQAKLENNYYHEKLFSH